MVRNCKWCEKEISPDRRPDTLYCDQNCRKAAHRARNPYVKREPRRECSVEDCSGRHYARGLCGRHWKNFSRYGDAEANYAAAHAKARKRWGDASANRCVRCGGQAKDLAYQHTAGENELRTPKGSPFSMNPEDYAPMCGICHSALDRSKGGAQQGSRRDLPWIGRGNRSPFPRDWRINAFRRWVCADGKRPIRPNGHPASSTDPSTWTNWEMVRQSRAGDGVGVMLGGGLGCYDLDHVTDAEVRDFLATVPEPVLYVERSMSGDGVHVFIEAPEGPGWRRVIDGISVERYTRQRFIRVTGDRLDF